MLVTIVICTSSNCASLLNTHFLLCRSLHRYDGVKYSILINPDVLKLTGSGSAVGDMPTGATPEEAHWLSVARGVDLLPEQAGDCIILFDLLTAWSRRLLAQRSRLSGCLTGMTSFANYESGVMQAPTLGDELEQLHKNVVQERWVGRRQGAWLSIASIQEAC